MYRRNYLKSIARNNINIFNALFYYINRTFLHFAHALTTWLLLKKIVYSYYKFECVHTVY